MFRFCRSFFAFAFYFIDIIVSEISSRWVIGMCVCVENHPGVNKNGYENFKALHQVQTLDMQVCKVS
jgi:hypothetical protein